MSKVIDNRPFFNPKQALKQLKARKKLRKLIAFLLALLLIVGSLIVLYFKLRSKDEDISVAGEAEPILTTPLGVQNGIWDEKRYSDELYYPQGLLYYDGYIYVADYMCDRIQIIGGEKNVRVGKPEQYGLSYMDSGALIDGWRGEALFMKPTDITVTPDGEFIICDSANNVIRKMDDDYVVTIAGNGKAGYQNGKEGNVMFNAPRSVAVGADGTIYVADTMNHCIRTVAADGSVRLFAGTPEKSGFGDGALAQAQFYEPCGLFITDDNILYVADSANHSIRKIENGSVTTVAGAPGELDRESGYPYGGYADGLNSEVQFYFPRDVAVLDNGVIAVADSMNHAIRLIDGESTRTLVGSGKAGQFYSSAENLALARPEGVFANGDTLYISDTLNNCIIELQLNESILAGRPSRNQMLADAGIATNSKYSYNGETRVYIGTEKVDMGRVAPWSSEEYTYIPIRPLLEALGATVIIDDKTSILSIRIGTEETQLVLNQDYFFMKGVAVTTMEEVVRLFPYTLEWFPEYSLISMYIPPAIAQLGK